MTKIIHFLEGLEKTSCISSCLDYYYLTIKMVSQLWFHTYYVFLFKLQLIIVLYCSFHFHRVFFKFCINDFFFQSRGESTCLTLGNFKKTFGEAPKPHLRHNFERLYCDNYTSHLSLMRLLLKQKAQNFEINLKDL